MVSPKEHVEEIRRNKFSIGKEPNPLIEDLHQAVKNLSVELYTKDVHFLMELIQNAEDNLYSEGVKPSLEFIITSKDITATGAPATLLIFNNEKGFSESNIESVCSVGRSTKKGKRGSGFIGEKGIGFKSVFLVTTQPYIFSNGYQIRFKEKPCQHCGLGYIVPEWVEEKPTLKDIKQIYGAGVGSLPTTTIVLPLKPDKVKPVKEQLANVHPEVLLFLSKIRHLSVREDNQDPKLNSANAISISSEVNFVTRKNINAESFTLELSAQENDSSEKKCSYYMWKQKFPVRLENMVERRMGVEEWVITLAFPYQDRLTRGTSSAGVYAFIPTEMITKFPFIIQADFVLASSRETILMDDKWNNGILDCVPSAFVDAFKALITGSNEAPVTSLAEMFNFIPIDSSPYEKLNLVREKIKAKLIVENILPIEQYMKQKHFCKPCEVVRLLPEFWDVLNAAEAEGVYLHNLSSHDGRKILSSSLDVSKYDGTLKFLGVQQVNTDWYAKCIQSSNLVDGVSESVYLKLLLFVATNWRSRFSGSNMLSIPLLKYVNSDASLSHFSIYDCAEGGMRLVRVEPNQPCPSSWLIIWNREFASDANQFFMPETTQKALLRFSQRLAVLEWLENYVNFTTLNVFTFAKVFSSSVRNNSKLAIAYAHFLYHSFSQRYFSGPDVDSLCRFMPLVDNYGFVNESRQVVLVPASISKWASLMISNPWRNENYIELGKEYLHPSCYAGKSTNSKNLIQFLADHLKASDLPDIIPPNAGFSAANAHLTKNNAFLLLDWIRNLNCRCVSIPERFLKCIREGGWLKVTVNGYMPPSMAFLISSSLGKILQMGSGLVDIPLIDVTFYGSRIHEYVKELQTVGVMMSYDEACEFIGNKLIQQATSLSLTGKHVILMLNFIQYQRKSVLPLDKFVNSLKNGSWLKTSNGSKSPVGSVLYDSGWEVASHISAIPFIDHTYYGEEIFNFKEELKLLGVIVGFSQNYKLVIENLKSPSNFGSLKAEAVLLLLECVKFSSGSSELISLLNGASFLQTNMGLKRPGECFLCDPVWGCILEVFDGLPLIDDHNFYGEKIFIYKEELKKLGVVVDFAAAIKQFAQLFKQKMVSQASFNQEYVKSLLSCFRKLKETQYKFPSDFLATVQKEKWLRTRVGGYCCPKDCILDGVAWNSISSITCLPFIDDSDNCYGKGIHEYKEELKSFGIITELKDGVKYVLKCLNFPLDPSIITPESVFSLLECIRVKIKAIGFPNDDEHLKKRLSVNWLRTYAGYKSADKCLLFNSKWSSYLKQTDGPFIDEDHYGPKLATYKEELKALGVTVDIEHGCILIANHLEFLSDHHTIEKFYKYLSEHNWKPDDKAARKIWIPESSEWVNPEECIIHDQDNLFGSKFYILGEIYDKKILPWFSSAMKVRNRPTVDDYVILWNEWESSGNLLNETMSYDKCSKFWMFMLENLTKNIEKKLSDSLMKLPASSGDSEIYLLDKKNVFVPDNLHLTKLFEQEKVIVWYPQKLMPSSRSDLFDLYRKIGARNISESICMEEPSMVDDTEVKQVDATKVCDMRVLVKLILGYLSCSSLKMEPSKRHEAVKDLLNLSFFETKESVTVSYKLSLSSGGMVTKEDNKMVRWYRQSSRLFTQMNWDSENASLIKYATYFSEAISDGILQEKHDHVPALSELITLACLLKFNSDAIEFLMESKNLQIFSEDNEFLCSAFS